MNLADCRAAVRAVRGAEHGREALGVLRPRSVLGIVRARGPVVVMLRVAAAEGRFVRVAPDSFALLERPMALPAPRAARGGPGLRFLRLVDRRWDALIFAVPPTLALSGAAVRPSLVSVWLALAAAGYVTVFMVAHVVQQSVWLRRALGRHARTADELAAESLPGWNWSMPLCHHTAAGSGRDLLRLAADRMADLVRNEVRQQATAAGAEPEQLRVREVLVCLTRGVTTEAMRVTVGQALVQAYGPQSRVALRLPQDPVAGTRAPVQTGGGFFLLWLAGIAAVVAVLALLVPSWERQACPVGGCGERPTTYLAALEWLAFRLLWQNPPGVVPGAVQSIVLGWLLSVVGLMTVPVAWVSVRLTVNASKRMAVEFEQLKGSALARTRVMLLTVTDVERDAVLAAMRAVTGTDVERSFAERVTVYELGSVSDTTVAMVQCARPGAGGPGGAQATAKAAIDEWKPDLLIMVGICYGLREDWLAPQRLGDVIVASAIYDLDKRIEYDERTELLGDRVATKSVLVGRLQAASTDWHTAAVHVGLLLSAQTLVDSKDRRDELKREHSRALGGEMEAQGLYAAAADAGVPWIVVKAISDWGVERRAHYAPKEAAANAASFVAHAVSLRAFDPTARHAASPGPGAA